MFSGALALQRRRRTVLLGSIDLFDQSRGKEVIWVRLSGLSIRVLVLG
jgi:hypothetical protein